MTIKKQTSYKPFLIFLCILFFLAIGGIALMLTPFYQVEASKTSFTMELGQKPSKNPSDYLIGESWSVPLSIVDTSKVDTSQVGSYKIKIYHGLQSFDCTVHIEDTTPPEIKTDIHSLTVLIGETLSLEKLSIRAHDYSKVTAFEISHATASLLDLDYTLEESYNLQTLFASGVDVCSDSYMFPYGGIYSIFLTATDEWDNQSFYEMKVTVEEAPHIRSFAHYYVALDTKEADYRQYIETWDFLDTEYNVDDIEIDTSMVNLEETGNYPITFSGTDDYGLTSSVTATVHVAEANEIQNLINNHMISVQNAAIIGALNPYDIGFYKEHNPTFIQEAMLPAIVHIENPALENYGSGFILQITEEYVTIATNHHVIMETLTPEVYFYDGSCYHAAIVAYDIVNDIAFLKIPISENKTIASITPDDVKKLRTVHINEEYWNNIENTDEFTICYNCFDTNGEHWASNIGTLVEKEALRDWNEYLNLNECIISPEPVAGSSGSAIFDGYGNLIAMIRGFTEYDAGYIETIAIPLSVLLDFYEETFEEKIQYQ